MAINIPSSTFSLFGLIQLHGYGLAIALGVFVTGWCTYRHLKRFLPTLTVDTFSNALVRMVLAGIIGGRLMHIFYDQVTYTSLLDYIALWQGGFSILGAVLAIGITLPFILREQAIPLFPTLDIIALYAPLAHAFGRLGCFMAGCCFGIPTHVPWAVCYQDSWCAPSGVPLHPTQLYSLLSFLVLFALLYTIHRNYFLCFRKPGMMVLLSIVGTCCERFTIDFLRGDRLMSAWLPLSVHQLAALVLGGCALLFLGVYWIVSKGTPASLLTYRSKV
jgi:phosphatidylglycerol---prolipoprotein diacylglyceryl transferase